MAAAYSVSAGGYKVGQESLSEVIYGKESSRQILCHLRGQNATSLHTEEEAAVRKESQIILNQQRFGWQIKKR